jgi:hypothetical protein
MDKIPTPHRCFRFSCVEPMPSARTAAVCAKSTGSQSRFALLCNDAVSPNRRERNRPDPPSLEEFSF